jgi:hypothetical protein
VENSRGDEATPGELLIVRAAPGATLCLTYRQPINALDPPFGLTDPEKGSYDYSCTLHPQMRGEVVVG